VFFDFEVLAARNRYKLLTATVTPRPIAWIVSQNQDGALNAAPFSFFNVVCADPATVCIGIGSHVGGRDKDTLSNIRASGEFVINLVTEADAEAMNTTAAVFPTGVDELSEAGIHSAPSNSVAPPRIASSPVSLECRMVEVVDLSEHNHLVIARILGMHVVDHAIKNPERYWIDTAKLKLVGRMESPGWYTRTSDRFMMNVPDVKEQSS
jgi:flavin reductase (DIM6/NTAB) family NADH-FMN oxidoreductase RutF